VARRSGHRRHRIDASGVVGRSLLLTPTGRIRADLWIAQIDGGVPRPASGRPGGGRPRGAPSVRPVVGGVAGGRDGTIAAGVRPARETIVAHPATDRSRRSRLDGGGRARVRGVAYPSGRSTDGHRLRRRFPAGRVRAGAADRPDEGVLPGTGVRREDPQPGAPSDGARHLRTRASVGRGLRSTTRKARWAPSRARPRRAPGDGPAAPACRGGPPTSPFRRGTARHSSRGGLARSGHFLSVDLGFRHQLRSTPSRANPPSV
jgi:hypothetical protein